MKWPFGYEARQSSGDREMPERTRVIRAFLLTRVTAASVRGYREGKVNVSVGLFGTATASSIQRGTAPTTTRDDFIGRAGFRPWAGCPAAFRLARLMHRQGPSDAYRAFHTRDQLWPGRAGVPGPCSFGATSDRE